MHDIRETSKLSEDLVERIRDLEDLVEDSRDARALMIVHFGPTGVILPGLVNTRMATAEMVEAIVAGLKGKVR